jgi:CRP-like cAMP-binding protein
MPVKVLQEFCRKSPNARDLFLRHAHCLAIQTAATALSNAQADAQTRLARWLLMVHDRTGNDELQITHEVLAVMLGVRRPWVTGVLNSLALKGTISLSRGKVIIRNRDDLIAVAGDFYGLPEREYRRYINPAEKW